MGEATTVYIDRRMPKKPTRKPVQKGSPALTGGRKRVLLVLFVPSVERDGVTGVDQEYWAAASLGVLGRQFGGATAYPKAKGVWRDDEQGGTLVEDEPVVVHCYTTPEDIENDAKLGSFCRRMGREANQGEVGLVVGDEYFAIQDFEGA